MAVIDGHDRNRGPEALMAAVLLQKPIGRHIRERRRDQRALSHQANRQGA